MLENLKKLREAKGISQKALADQIGISQQSINKYENHNIEPDIHTLTRLADYFDTSVDYLIGYTTLSRRIEAFSPYDLNSTEASLINGYRKLNPKRRKLLQSLIESYLEE